MSEIRDYLEATLEREGAKGWLRRNATHPAILRAVRDFVDSCEDTPYDDLTERHVEAIAGDLPEHYPHGHEKRDPLTYQLGHEVYIARGVLKDEANQAEIDAATAAGFRLLDDARTGVEIGKRYTVRAGTVYVGQSLPSFGKPIPVRGRERPGGGVGFVRKGARNFVHIPTPTLIREGWD